MVKDASSLFPWDQIKAESMRSVCRDLGVKLNHSNRAMMTHFLERVYKIGLPKALAQDEPQPHPTKSQALSTPTSSRKRTRRATTPTPISTRSAGGGGASSPKRRPNRGTKQEAEEGAEYQNADEDEEDDEEDEDEEQEQEPSSRKRPRRETNSAAVAALVVTSDYNTRFKADRRGRMSDLGPRTRSLRTTATTTRGRVSEPMTVVSAPVTPRRPRRPVEAARSRGVIGSARRAITAGGSSGRRVRVAEPTSSETEEGDDVGDSASVVVTRRKRRAGFVRDRSPARKRRAVFVRGPLVNGVDEGEGDDQDVVAAPVKRARRTSSSSYRKPVRRAGRMSTGKRVVADVGPKLVFDGIDVPPLSKAMVAAIKRKDMVFGDEDADGEVDENVAEAERQRALEPEPEPELEPTASVVEQNEDAVEGDIASAGGEEDVAPEGGEEDVAPEDGDEEMPVDEAEIQGNIVDEEEEEDDGDFGEIIPDDTSSLGNSNKENEAPDEGMSEEQETMEMDTIQGVTTTMSIEEEMAARAAEALFGASTSAMSVPIQSDGEPSNVTEEDDLNSFLT